MTCVRLQTLCFRTLGVIFHDMLKCEIIELKACDEVFNMTHELGPLFEI